MSTMQTQVYVSVDDRNGLAHLLHSLQECGVQFNASAQMKDWFEENGLTPQQILSPAEMISHLSREPEESWIFVLHGSFYSVVQSEREGLISYLLSQRQRQPMVLTHPQQYPLLINNPKLLSDPQQQKGFSSLLFNNMMPGELLHFVQPRTPYAIPPMSYALNPSWLEALQFPMANSEKQLSKTHWQSVLNGTHLLVQMARTEGLGAVQAILMQHGLPVNISCHNRDIVGAVAEVLFQETTLTPGSTLVTSHPLSATTLADMAQAGIQIVVSPQWESEALKSLAGKPMIPVQFDVSRLQVSTTGYNSISPDSLVFQTNSGEQREVTWLTPNKPFPQQMIDLELGVLMAEYLHDCTAIIMKDQRTLAVASGMPLPIEAVEYALQRISGETKDAVCILTGTVHHEHVFDALIQSRLAGVLFYHPVNIPPSVIQGLDKQDLFVGSCLTPELSRMNPVLEETGTYHE